MDTGILEQLKETFGEERGLVHSDLKAMERLVRQKTQLLGQGLPQRLLARKKNGCKAIFAAVPAE